MIPIKVQCGCGQKYSFEVEPADGRMASPVACPVCGADGTAAANGIIAEVLAAQSQAAPAHGLRLHVDLPGPTPAVPHQPPPLPRRLPSVAAAPIKLKWYEQAWIALPIALLAVGGAIGGGCGGAAWAINRTVFKKTTHPVLRYVWTGLISAAAVVVWLVIVAFILSLLKRR